MNKVESAGESEGESVKVCGSMGLGSHREQRAGDDLETLTLAGRTVSQRMFLEAFENHHRKLQWPECPLTGVNVTRAKSPF